MTDRADEIAAKVYDSLDEGQMISEMDLADEIHAYGDERAREEPEQCACGGKSVEHRDPWDSISCDKCGHEVQGGPVAWNRDKIRNAALEKAAEFVQKWYMAPVDKLAAGIRAMKEGRP